MYISEQKTNTNMRNIFAHLPISEQIGWKKVVERIVTVKEWNETAAPDGKIKAKKGYVMPTHAGYEYRKTKRELIKKFTPANI